MCTQKHRISLWFGESFSLLNTFRLKWFLVITFYIWQYIFDNFYEIFPDLSRCQMGAISWSWCLHTWWSALAWRGTRIASSYENFIIIFNFLKFLREKKNWKKNDVSRTRAEASHLSMIWRVFLSIKCFEIETIFGDNILHLTRYFW